jgi:hypothetical protein
MASRSHGSPTENLSHLLEVLQMKFQGLSPIHAQIKKV